MGQTQRTTPTPQGGSFGRRVLRTLVLSSLFAAVFAGYLLSSFPLILFAGVLLSLLLISNRKKLQAWRIFYVVGAYGFVVIAWWLRWHGR